MPGHMDRPTGAWEGLSRHRDALTFKDGRTLKIRSIVRHDGHWYAQGAGSPRRRHPGQQVRPGTVVVRYLGYRIHRDHASLPIPYYLVRCSHGNEFPTLSQHLTPSGRWTGHTNACLVKERLCRWCGEDDASKFNKYPATACMACDRTRHRRGTHECGKPKRIQAPMTPPKEEHHCELCEPWRTRVR